MDSGSPHRNKGSHVHGNRSRTHLHPLVLASIAALLLLPACAAAAQAQPARPEPPLPDAPPSHLPDHAQTPSASPCQSRRAGSAPSEEAAAAATASDPSHPALSPSLQPAPCPPHEPLIDWYSRFLNGPEVKQLSPKEKARLAARNLLDPFNAITILANSAIYVGSNAHSPVGPGMTGFGRDVGISFTQDMTGEFFGTFLIPAIVHQDPHYHRMPYASIPRRATHAITQVVWTQGDDGKGMVNYANLVGFAIDDQIGNLYVPGRNTSLPSSADRYVIALATAPVDNFITEFLPDVARRIHIRVVLVQRIINQVAKTEGGGQ